jgi:type I restriction enzyme S subunit
MATSQHFANYICGPNLHPKFLMWLFRSSRAFVQSKSLGSVLPDVYMNVIHQFRVCLPDLPTQQKIAARLDEAFRTIQQLQSAHKVQLEALDKLPGAYLREAFGSLTY